MRLPRSVQEIADVIGAERALFLIGHLPRCYVGGKSGSAWGNGKRVPSERLIMYVPKVLKPDHDLVKILGWQDAQKLVKEFGGLIMYPATCAGLYRSFRDENIKRLAKDGVPVKMLADWFNVSERSIKNVVREIPQEEVSELTAQNPAIYNKTQRQRSEALNMATA